MFGVPATGFFDFVGTFVGRKVLHPPPTEIAPDLSSDCEKNLFWYRVTLPRTTDQLGTALGGGAYGRNPNMKFKRLM